MWSFQDEPWVSILLYLTEFLTDVPRDSVRKSMLIPRNAYPECPDLSALGLCDSEGNLPTPLFLFLPSASCARAIKVSLVQRPPPIQRNTCFLCFWAYSCSSASFAVGGGQGPASRALGCERGMRTLWGQAVPFLQLGAVMDK